MGLDPHLISRGIKRFVELQYISILRSRKACPRTCDLRYTVYLTVVTLLRDMEMLPRCGKTDDEQNQDSGADTHGLYSSFCV